MTDDKVLMVKLRSGSYIESGRGEGFEKFNIDEKATIDGKYYGVILNSGRQHDISLEDIDSSADKKTIKIEGVLLIYFEEIEKITCIVAIAENTTIYRKIQNDEDIIKNRLHYEYKPNGEIKEITNVGYHTFTAVEDMHLLKEKYIPISIPRECSQFFRAQRAMSKEIGNRGLRNQIIDKTLEFLNNTEIDLRYEQIESATIVKGRSSSNEPLSVCFSSNGYQINKKPWVSRKALSKAEYLCECDPTHRTFLTNKGNPYMEGHHLIRCTVKISKEFMERYSKNIDTESNIVSLCPNCHRRIHFGNAEEKLEIIERLYKVKRNELHENGIKITLDELNYIYGI